MEETKYWMQDTTQVLNNILYTGAKECLRSDENAYVGRVLLCRMLNDALVRTWILKVWMRRTNTRTWSIILMQCGLLWIIHNHGAVWAYAHPTSLLPLSVPPKTHKYRTIKSSVKLDYCTHYSTSWGWFLIVIHCNSLINYRYTTYIRNNYHATHQHVQSKQTASYNHSSNTASIIYTKDTNTKVKLKSNRIVRTKVLT